MLRKTKSTFTWATLTAAAISMCASTAQAVVVHGDAMDVPANSFIGTWRGGTAIAVGEHYIVTAAHMGGHTNNHFKMDGVLYDVESIHVHPFSDLQIIKTVDPLPGWHEIGRESDIDEGSEVVLGGMGLVDAEGTPNGYYWSDSKAERWGCNTIDFLLPSFMAVRFDQDGMNHEGIFAMYDSGGGVFIQQDGALKLVGLAVSVDSADGFAAWGNRGYAINMTTAGGFLKKVQLSDTSSPFDMPNGGGNDGDNPLAAQTQPTSGSKGSASIVRVRTVTRGAEDSETSESESGSGVRTVRPNPRSDSDREDSAK